jgi:peptide/nickel transport system permease protein
MTAYIVRRLVLAVIVFFLITILVFMVMRLLPGDPILMLISQSEADSSTEEQIAELRHKFGLDRPMIVQYFAWIGNALQGDLGISIANGRNVASDIASRIPVTLHLGVVALVISFFLGVIAGVICAVRRGGWVDTIITTLANIGITIPVFWLGVVLMYIFALRLNWLPVFGYTSPFTDFWLSTRQIILPVFCLAVTSIASTARQTRSSMLEVLHQDYIRTAWAKGLKERAVIIKHALKNGLIPVLTLVGIHLSGIIGGSVLIETVFNIPGMGRLAVTAMFNQDYPVIQGVILFFAVTVILTNLIIDMSYGWLDPRIQYK